MRIADLPAALDVSAVCHYCGEAAPVVAWLGFDAESVLSLCRECAWSIAGGLLLDLADSDTALESLFSRLRARRAACEAVRSPAAHAQPASRPKGEA